MYKIFTPFDNWQISYGQIIAYHNTYHLTHKQLEMHRCIISTFAADALVLKLQAISIHIVG